MWMLHLAEAEGADEVAEPAPALADQSIAEQIASSLAGNAAGILLVLVIVSLVWYFRDSIGSAVRRAESIKVAGVTVNLQPVRAHQRELDSTIEFDDDEIGRLFKCNSKLIVGRHILWIDDKSNMNAVEAQALRGFGVGITNARGLDDATTVLGSNSPDLIITNLSRPSDGVGDDLIKATTEWLRSQYDNTDRKRTSVRPESGPRRSYLHWPPVLAYVENVDEDKPIPFDGIARVPSDLFRLIVGELIKRSAHVYPGPTPDSVLLQR